MERFDYETYDTGQDLHKNEDVATHEDNLYDAMDPAYENDMVANDVAPKNENIASTYEEHIASKKEVNSFYLHYINISLGPLWAPTSSVCPSRPSGTQAV